MDLIRIHTSPSKYE